MANISSARFRRGFREEWHPRCDSASYRPGQGQDIVEQPVLMASSPSDCHAHAFCIILHVPIYFLTEIQPFLDVEDRNLCSGLENRLTTHSTHSGSTHLEIRSIFPVAFSRKYASFSWVLVTLQTGSVLGCPHHKRAPHGSSLNPLISGTPLRTGKLEGSIIEITIHTTRIPKCSPTDPKPSVKTICNAETCKGKASRYLGAW
ncbi:uncharacterized protein BT62DRAFT_1079750 [Guyanagaster necrorhizus]|uniref:Uncharacterized protein n=1 Tax=Guyanagaster necrorhizus TaxID=856835 RepID=A0A9P7VIP6_9AGAR|nr:uncharacterized protein BT62DRAFT_1079750 [Guyanagaster necrorhizus MCA 3950]KAG7441793.1 hypothetical protein BT62DRAFT_1079750 [Guyanagaster necrorhizus MCA 3950]